MTPGAARGRSFFMSDFKKLHLWQRAHALSLRVDRVSKQIRGGRYASLRSQIFRAATSIPANIAEGRRQESEGILSISSLRPELELRVGVSPDPSS
jgi:hypothetical protein